MNKSENEITICLQKHLSEIKNAIKTADKDREGALQIGKMREIMESFGLKLKSYQRFTGGGDMVDYIAFLKYYL